MGEGVVLRKNQKRKGFKNKKCRNISKSKTCKIDPVRKKRNGINHITLKYKIIRALSSLVTLTKNRIKYK